MSFANRIYNQQGVYFVTFTVHQWVDVFTRNEYKDIVVDSLRYCQKEKGLNIYAWVLMSNTNLISERHHHFSPLTHP